LRKFIIWVCWIFVFDFSYSQNTQFIPRSKGASCCCGQFVELFFPNLDFEEAPSPLPGNLITYWAGETFSGWTCTRASIDHKDGFFGNLTLGNPNGRSNFIDLHGSPGFGAIEYILTGLTSGNEYRIEFWTAQNGSGYSSTGTLKIANGAWLNGNWTVDTDGSILWFKVTFMFTAKASTAKMEFSSTGGSEWGGTLIDDIKIFECPGDVTAPVFDSQEDDVEVTCDSEVPKAVKLTAMDVCDLSPDIIFKETFQIVDPCTKIITRTWEATDDCGNIATEKQIITVADKTPPEFLKLPQNKWTDCNDDVSRLFADWLKNNANAIASDDCGKVSWRNSIDHNPNFSCDTVIVEFFAIDHCGQESSAFASFYVIDTTAPKFSKIAESRTLQCNPNIRDSLRNWLKYHAYAIATDPCDTVYWSDNFDGDSTKNNIKLSFYVKDRCGNIDSTVATFLSRSSSDTFTVNVNSCTIPKSKSDTIKYSSNNCDSIVIVNTIRLTSDTVSIQLNTCDSSHLKFDTIHLNNISGCDSMVITTYVLQAAHKTYFRDSSCAIKTYFTETVIVPGQYCDSFLISEHFPLRSDSVFINQSSCDSTQAGNMILNLQNQFSCDSVVSILTVFSQQSVSHMIRNECGITNVYYDTMTFTTNLCDSIVITMHIPLKEDSVFVQQHTCDPAAAGIFKNRFVNTSGCDSLVVVEKLLDPKDSSYQSKTSCNASDAGIVKNIYKNKFGCDSLVITETFFIATDSSTIQTTTCILNQAGMKRTMLKNKAGCDSIVIEQKIFVASDTTISNLYSCNLADQKQDTVIYSTSNCDSIVIQSVKFVPSDTSYLKSSTCILAEALMDTLIYKNKLGCDSIVFSEIIFKPINLQLQLDSISCYNRNDGAIHLLNVMDFSKPFQVVINQQLINGNSVISNLAAGSYGVYVIDQRNCLTDTINFTLFEPEELITELGSDLEVKSGSKVELNLSSNKILQFINWSPAGISICNNCNKIEFIADRDEWIYTLSIDERGCVSKDSIFIRVKKSTFVYAPNAISPNGDNINDHFYLIADNESVIELMQIYDRWGELIFEAQNILPNNPDLGWNGLYNSQKMNPGVYVYYARVNTGDGAVQILKGDFTLVR
jgi:gliding motility-associated-like protein